MVEKIKRLLDIVGRLERPEIEVRTWRKARYGRLTSRLAVKLVDTKSGRTIARRTFDLRVRTAAANCANWIAKIQTQGA